MKQYSKDYPLKYKIIVHENGNKWVKNLVLVIGIISIICLLRPIHTYYKETYLELIFFFIALICAFSFSYLTFYKKDFRATGYLIFTGDKLFVENEGAKTTFNKDELKNFTIELNFFEYIPRPFNIPRLSVRISRGVRLDGSKNFIEFEHNNKPYSYEILIENKSQMDLLSIRAEEWNVKTNL